MVETAMQSARRPDYCRWARYVLAGALVGCQCALAQAPVTGGAQDYPSRQIRIVAGTAAGGGVDTISRIVGQKLSDKWGQQVIIDNRAGAGGAVGSELVAKAAADGYTLLTISISYAVIPNSHRNLGYDPVRSLIPVMVLVIAPNVLVVHPSLPVQSVKELLAFAKVRRGQIYYASSGNGSPAHLAVELLKLMTGVEFVHVPYKGTAPGITDLLAGRLSLTFASEISVMPFVKAGKLRALAVGGSKRSATIFDIPTVAQAGVPGYEVDVWYAAFAPAATPKAIVTQLNEEIGRILRLPETKDRLTGLGLEPVGNTPEQAATYINAEITKWAKVVKSADIHAD